MNADLLTEFLDSFDASRYPAEFLSRYEALECLSVNAQGETLRVRRRSDGLQAVAKCYVDAGLNDANQEGLLLSLFDRDDLPRLLDEYSNDKMVCVVRTYAKGRPLSEPGLRESLTQEQILSIGLNMTDVLLALHGHEPPIIHRDIKPQNVIYDDDGKITLIDFGISRAYRTGEKHDTVFFGTQGYALPEQYGYNQTYNRSDIYSLGALLRYLFTGDPDPETGGKQIPDKAIRKALLKCMAFSPKDRYKDVQQVRRALLALRPAARRRRKALMAVACLAVAAALVTGAVTLINQARASDTRRIYLEKAGQEAAYLNEKYDYDGFSNDTRIMEFQDIRRILTGAYGYDVGYTWATPPPDPPYPHEDPGNFYPWTLTETEPVFVELAIYTMAKVYFPELIVEDPARTPTGDNGNYPGMNLAMAFAEASGIVDGVPHEMNHDQSSFADVSIIFANAARLKDADPDAAAPWATGAAWATPAP